MFSKHSLLVKLSILEIRKNFDCRVKRSTKNLLFVRHLVNECSKFMKILEESESFKVTKYRTIHTCALETRMGDHQQAKSSGYRTFIQVQI